MQEKMYMVIPCYNEREVLPETSKRLKEKFKELVEIGIISDKSRVVLVDDGSKDETWEIISALHGEDKLFSGVKLSRNRGHQNALLAGLMFSAEDADFTISMDADLQDDINAIDEMIEKYYAGCDIVYGVRGSRKEDSFFKRFTAEGFYKVIASMGAEVVFNHADYRLLSRRALAALSEYRESNLYLRGIVPMIGYKTAVVEYKRGQRYAGESKYPLKKMLALAVEGITSLSAKPMRLISALGVFLFAASTAVMLYALIRTLMSAAFPGWAFALLSVWMAAGLLMLSIGIVGEYVGKIYLETKNRPRFFIEQNLHDSGDCSPKH